MPLRPPDEGYGDLPGVAGRGPPIPSSRLAPVPEGPPNCLAPRRRTMSLRQGACAARPAPGVPRGHSTDRTPRADDTLRAVEHASPLRLGIALEAHAPLTAHLEALRLSARTLIHPWVNQRPSRK